MGLPIFGLILALVSHTLVENYDTLKPSFYIESILLLLVGIYFIFYLIYSGFDVKITDDVSKTFSREYLLKYLKKELKSHKEYTLILVTVDNLSDINALYGIKNGDKILQKVVNWIVEYLKSQNIENFPMGHLKGGDFIIGLKGLKSEYSTVLELLCLKSGELKIDDIEVKISGALIDTLYSNELNYMIEKMFEIQEKNREFKNRENEENIDPSELEFLVINAIKQREVSIMTQSVFSQEKEIFKECFVKLKATNGKRLFPKTYIKVINKLGLGVEYDTMIIEEVLRHSFKDKETACAVHIFPTSLRNEKFLSRVKDLLKDTNKKLIFILNEQEYYSYTTRYNSIIHSLKQYGAEFAIDRVGTIHTSFLYLRELDIDYIRFDGYYSDENRLLEHKNIVEGFELMAKEKGVKSWMKNIESLELLALSKEIGIECIQGKYLSDLEKNYES
ncbi:MAG: EAL domain-containing protein [Campylobacterales bacterium]|nr:EAL domain-containing protein [Campylobacterales bacterium]